MKEGGKCEWKWENWIKSHEMEKPREKEKLNNWWVWEENGLTLRKMHKIINYVGIFKNAWKRNSV